MSSTQTAPQSPAPLEPEMLPPAPPTLTRQPSARMVSCGCGHRDHLVLRYGSEYFGTVAYVVHASKARGNLRTELCTGDCILHNNGANVKFDPRPLTYEEWLLAKK